MPKAQPLKKKSTFDGVLTSVVDFTWVESHRHRATLSDGRVLETTKRETVDGKVLILNEQAYPIKIPAKSQREWDRRHWEYLLSQQPKGG